MGGKARGKVHPTAKCRRRSPGGKAWAGHESGCGQGHWKSGFHPSLSLGQAPLSLFACFYSQIRLPSLGWLENSLGQELALAMCLCNTAHRRILIRTQVCWHGCSAKTNSNIKKPHQVKRNKRCKHFKIWKNIQRQVTAGSSNEHQLKIWFPVLPLTITRKIIA